MASDQHTLDEITKRLVGETTITEELINWGEKGQFLVRRADGERRSFVYTPGRHTDRALLLRKAMGWADEAPGVVTVDYFGIHPR
jgi:hypothetical protein